MKNQMTSKECRRYRRYIQTEVLLEAIVTLLLAIFIALILFCAGMIYERKFNGHSNISSNSSSISNTITNSKNIH